MEYKLHSVIVFSTYNCKHKTFKKYQIIQFQSQYACSIRLKQFNVFKIVTNFEAFSVPNLFLSFLFCGALKVENSLSMPIKEVITV